MSNHQQNYISNYLENVELAHRESPITYSIPRREQRENLQIGDLVKLVFLIDPSITEGPNAERMWVEVKVVKESGGYVGALDNDPHFISNLKYGDMIEFSPENVAALYVADKEKQIPYEKKIMVSPEILEKEILPRFLIRKEPIDDQYSGWWLSGHKPDLVSGWEYEDKFVSLLVGDMVSKFMILDSVLDEPIGTQWIWNEDTLEYENLIE